MHRAYCNASRRKVMQQQQQKLSRKKKKHEKHGLEILSTSTTPPFHFHQTIFIYFQLSKPFLHFPRVFRTAQLGVFNGRTTDTRHRTRRDVTGQAPIKMGGSAARWLDNTVWSRCADGRNDPGMWYDLYHIPESPRPSAYPAPPQKVQHASTH